MPDGNTAWDRSAELAEARSQSNENLSGANNQLQSPGQFNVPQNGRAGDHAQATDNNTLNSAGLHSAIKNKASEAENMLPHQLREKLDDARQKYDDAKQLGGEAKTLIKSATPWGVVSLIGKIHPLTDIPYFFAIMAAMLKDGLDFIGIGSLPAIGTAVTACTSIFIAMMMFLGNVSHSEHDRTIFQSVILKQVGVLIFTTIIEFIFGLDLAPFQTVGVLLIYSFALAARKGRDNV